MCMRTTLNIDDDLLERMTRRFPPGTPKTVIIEESLRRVLADMPRTRGPRGGFDLPDDVALLVARGVLTPPARSGVPPMGTSGTLPPGALLRDLAADREDR